MATKSDRLWIYETVKELAAADYSGGFEGWIGLKVPCKKPDLAKIEPIMRKAKKPAELYATFDAKKLTVDVRIGTAYKQVLGALDIEGEKDIEKRRTILKTLNTKNKKLFADADLYAFTKAHPDKETLDDDRAQVASLKPEIEKLKAKVAGLKNLSYDHCASAELSRGLRNWVESKHWGHYLAFLRDIDSGADSKTIYDKYIGEAKHPATLPVNLESHGAARIKQALDANQIPDFAAARAQIVKMVDTKFVPEYKKENLPALEKELKHKEQYLGELNQVLAKH